MKKVCLDSRVMNPLIGVIVPKKIVFFNLKSLDPSAQPTPPPPFCFKRWLIEMLFIMQMEQLHVNKHK